MKLAMSALLVATLALAACAAEQASPVPEDAEDANVSQDELTAAAGKLVGKYEWRDGDSGSFLDFQRLELYANGTYSASVDAGLVDPGVRCAKFPCTLPETGTWSTFKSAGNLKLRVRPQGHPTRSYLASKANDQLTLGRFGDTTVLFQLGVTTCANVRCTSGTHCEMKSIHGGQVPACVEDHPPVASCADTRCAPGTHCEMKGMNGGRAIPVCVQDPPPAPCVKTGCSSQICADRDMVTTCDWKPDYACYQAATCERQADGACGFTQTASLTQCLATH